MSVEDIIAHAGVSRRTFYEHFKNREHAFLAAYDAGVAQLFQRVVGAVDAADTLPAKVREGLASFLLYLANEPAFARMCIVEVLAAGPEALARRDQAMKGFATLLSENARLLMPADGPPAPELLAETIVGGIYEAVYTRIRRDEYQALPELLPDLMYGMLVPYVGPKEASGERGRIRGRTPAGQA